MTAYISHDFASERNSDSLSIYAFRLLNNKRWLDDFFNYGEIQLSNFNKFRRYPNEIQGDKREGNALCWFEDLEGNTKGIKYESGLNSYVLSTTEIVTEKIVSDFMAVGAIKISDTALFANEISKHIQSCFTGMEGKCRYADSRVFQLKDQAKLVELLKKENGIYTQEFIEEFQLQTAAHELFLKETKYQYQNEYRFIWFTSQPIENTLRIRCPEAIQYCERVDF